MQSGFGGIPEMQQFMVDNSAHPFFSISTTTPPPPNSIAAAPSHEIYHPSAITPTNKLFNTFHRQYSQPSPLPPPTHFSHFHSNIPITQQLFTPPPPHHHHHHHHHHLQLFHTNQENPPPPPFLPTDMKFKLAVDDNDVPTTILHADSNASESRLRSWHKEDNCAIKEPFWRPLDLDYINNTNNNKRCKDKESAELCFAKRNRVTEEMDNSHPDNNNNNNYKIFSELEAIYKPGGSNSTATELPPNNHNQTTGSGSALTGDDHRLISPVATATFDLDYRLDDDNSTGGEAQTILKKAQHHSRRRRRRRRRQMKSISAFFETLVKQLMDHQESLHHKFLNLMEQRDKDRILQEETRREQESARARRESIARAHDRELAAAREAAILSFLEKITGETINLPPYTNAEKNNDSASKDCNFISPATLTTNRWPKIEVQALIKVRSELDGQFQEPGLKGPLWEEVSTAMKTMGYNRNAKRCKEKWENINKYFRKNKDSGRKRSQQSKTCPYFHQLDQLYAKEDGRKVKNSELLDAVVVAGDAEEVEEEGDVEDDESSQFVELLQ